MALNTPSALPPRTHAYIINDHGSHLSFTSAFIDRNSPTEYVATATFDGELVFIYDERITLFYEQSQGAKHIDFQGGTSVVYDDVRSVLLITRENVVHEMNPITRNMKEFYKGDDNILSVLPKNQDF